MLLFKEKRTLLLFLLAALFFVSACKKKSAPEPDQLTQLKANLTGEWEVTKGLYMEYDETGKVSYTENDPQGSPAPWYDFRNAETLYLSDRHGREAIRYTVFVAADGTASIKLAETSIDISRTYTITRLTANEMTWVSDQRFSDVKPGFSSRVYLEYNFRKR